jgi:hypothetical protein
MLVVQSSSAPLREGLPFSVIVRRWYKLIESVRDPYRPELHYMREPDPKWYADRHGCPRAERIAAQGTRGRLS